MWKNSSSACARSIRTRPSATANAPVSNQAMTEGIAGDFLSLLESRKVPLLNIERLHAPVPTQAHVPLLQTQATTVFAFHYKDGVLMAGDRRATAGNVIVTDKVDKVIDIDATSILAIAGVPATA